MVIIALIVGAIFNKEFLVQLGCFVLAYFIGLFLS